MNKPYLFFILFIFIFSILFSFFPTGIDQKRRHISEAAGDVKLCESQRGFERPERRRLKLRGFRSSRSLVIEDVTMHQESIQESRHSRLHSNRHLCLILFTIQQLVPLRASLRGSLIVVELEPANI